MKKEIYALLGLVSLVASVAAAAPTASSFHHPTAFRVHTTFVSDFNYYNAQDSDFVITTDQASAADVTSKTLVPKRAVFGFVSSTPLPPSNPARPIGPITTTFFRGTPSGKALQQLQDQVASLDPVRLPSSCSQPTSTPFQSGGFEITLYQDEAAAHLVISVTLQSNPPPSTQCPPEVLSILNLLTDFFQSNAKPIL